jgi:hypothetical protein
VGVSREIQVLAVRADAPPARFAFSLPLSLTSGIVGDPACDGYYEVFLHVCLYSRSSRLLWGSGNARQNRMDEGRGVGAGFPNQDSPDVGVLENRWIASQRLSKDPKPSTDGDVRCAMLLWWMGGNLGANRS